MNILMLCREGGPYDHSPGARTIYPFPQPREGAEGGTLSATPAMRTLLRACWRSLAPGAAKSLAGGLREVARWRRFFRPLHLDLVYLPVFSWEPIALGARLAGIPCVLGTLHLDLDKHRPAERLLERLTARSLHYAIAVSDSTRRSWERGAGLDPRRVYTIYNGLDPQRFRRRLPAWQARERLGLPSQGLYLLGVGRLTVQKGFTYLLEATRVLSQEGHDLHVALAGEGPLEGELAKTCERLGIVDRVHFLGHRRDLQSVLDASDVFVLPSLQEALPYALLEAMATELPAVGTRVAGVPEVIVEGETGYVVPPRNPEALAAALRPLLRSPELRTRMGRAGRERVASRFNEQSMVRQTIEVLNTLLGRLERPGGRTAARKAVVTAE